MTTSRSGMLSSSECCDFRRKSATFPVQTPAMVRPLGGRVTTVCQAEASSTPASVRKKQSPLSPSILHFSFITSHFAFFQTASQSSPTTNLPTFQPSNLPIFQYSITPSLPRAPTAPSPIEKYISERSPADFSHGLCPECLQKHYGNLFKNDK